MKNWCRLITCIAGVALSGATCSLPCCQVFRNTEALFSTWNSVPWVWNICRDFLNGWCLKDRLGLSLDCSEVQAIAGIFFLSWTAHRIPAPTFFIYHDFY